MINFKAVDLTIEQCIDELTNKYQILDTINLDDYVLSFAKLHQRIYQNYLDVFENDQRIIISLTKDQYATDAYGSLLKSVQSIINTADISNFFIALVTTNKKINEEYQTILSTYSTDKISFELYECKGEFTTLTNNQIQEIGQHNVFSADINDDYVVDIIDNNKNFCIMPWIQTQARTTGMVYPCCLFDSKTPLGNSKNNSLEEIFNNKNTRQLRLDMLASRHIDGCKLCNINENTEKPTYRKTANSRHLDILRTAKHTKKDGTYPYKHIVWDIRFNNTCNLKCRTCNQDASTSWFSDAIRLPGNKNIKQVLSPTGIFDQYLQHVNHVKHIYFAGGEPLIIEKCWNILEELIKHNKLDVELVYNTNFTKLNFKGRNIFEYWKKFKQVHVGASLDAMGERAEYWRSGTKWKTIEQNRISMLNEAPDVGFNIDATVSLVNALHIVDFHREWVSKELITPSQFNPKALIYPTVFSLRQAPDILKQKVYDKISDHINWLTPLDKTEKSTSAFKSIISALENEQMPFDSEGFWEKIEQVDKLRNENLIHIFPELKCLETYKNA